MTRRLMIEAMAKKVYASPSQNHFANWDDRDLEERLIEICSGYSHQPDEDDDDYEFERIPDDCFFLGKSLSFADL